LPRQGQNSIQNHLGRDPRFEAHQAAIAKKDKMAKSEKEPRRRMGTTLKEKMASLPAKRRKKIEARAAELIAEELSLRERRSVLRC